ncbi:MAG: BspA family leucine-rich repeat surface protein [Clostridia bacterium]|nr:BspA family leucine-rich repeat surface protein [Clostridia bacterium]
MKTKKRLLIAVAIVLIAAISIAATIAFLTAEDSEKNVFTVGNVKIELLEYERRDIEATGAAEFQGFTDGKPLRPAVTAVGGFDYSLGQTNVDWEKIGKDGYTTPIWDPTKLNNEVDKMVFVKNTGDHSAYVRIYFAFEAGMFTDYDEFKTMIHVNLNDTAGQWKWEWIPFVGVNETTGTNYFVAKATYQKELAPGAITEISLSQVALDSTATNEHVKVFDGKYEVKVCAQGIQSAGFDAPHQALVEGFGRGVPFDDIYIEGNTMKNALHYLNGDLEGEDITNKVTSITFGLNNDYPEIADNYQGTPINDEQDYYVNVHYVPEGENFKLYVLADGPIYTPVDSTELFYKMRYVETIDMANLNTSRTEDMSWMLGSCSKLAELDLSTWDVSNVINMNGLLYECSSLTEISFDGWETTSLDSLQNFLRNCSSLKTADVSDLDTETVTNMHRTFYGCGALESIIGLDQWDTSNVNRMDQMFLDVGKKSSAMTEIDISNFDSSSVTLTSYMFSGCKNLKAVRFGENWDMAEVTTASNMFNGCTSLQNINVATEWKTDNLTEAAAMFSGCSLLTTDDLTKLGVSNWKTDKVTKMSSMFSGCSSLTTLDLSGWKTDNVTHMDSMFNNCSSLTALDVSGWKTDKVKFMSSMFNGCVGLTALDLSSCNTESIEKSEKMFAGCSNLVTISVGNGWNVTKAKSSADMFKDCAKLVGGSGTTLAKIKENEGKEVVDKTYARIDTPEAPGYLTYKAADSTNP